MEIELPYPPTVNHYWRHTSRGHYIAAEGINFRSAVRALILNNRPRLALCGELAAKIEVFPPDNRRRDLDNVLKAIFDALQYAGLYSDDYQICDFRVVRRPKTPGGLVRVQIAEVG